MDRVRLGKSEMVVAKVGFGGIPIQRLAKEEAVAVIRRALDLGVDWLDTANGYTRSEEYIGEALRSLDRSKLRIFSKSRAQDPEVLRAHVLLALERLRTDYLDLYQFHDLSDPARREHTHRNLLPVLQELKRRGMIRHIGASAHSLDAALEILEWPEIEVLQFPFNFIVEDISRKALVKAEEKDVGFIAMKPFGGGMIEDIPLCVRYLLDFPAAAMDPGFERVAEVEEVLALAEAGTGLTAGDGKRMAAIAAEMGRTFCRRCQYCSPCPHGVEIVTLMTIESFLKRMPPARILEGFINDAAATVSLCTRCGECETKCPYKLPIIERIAAGAGVYEAFAREYRGR